ncbi:FkbM family methyltransferase [uncultured Methanobrevibacter sp.]|uniref:FkbM family methyltransferase n=1 Tax=uncultured Methanobrevibacter sp. TaxID=253161 RepID=UPI0026054D20|nr:FkbM family methyltransferase [uncultured Methanobrevibacter sp.]
MSFKESILNKSNSYVYYKETTEKSLKEIELLNQKNEDLKNNNSKLVKEVNSLKYYKTESEALSDENDSLKEEIKKLNDNISSLKKQEGELKKQKETLQNQNNTLKKENDDPKLIFNKHYGKAVSFCNGSYIEYFLRDDFTDKLNAVTKNLNDRNTRMYKWYILRATATALMRKETFYFDDEVKQLEEFQRFKKENITEDGVCGFKYTGEFNLAGFINLNLNDRDLEFLKDKDIIDAGAFTGDTSLPLSRYTNRKIYAFEPFKESFETLNKNIADNNIENIIAINKSLGNINGERTLYLSGDNVQGITSDSHIRAYDNEIKVQETTIDTFVSENNLDVGYITIDVEGAELDLLNGAINTIKTQRPILVISLYHKASDFYEIIPWVANLGLDYEFEIFKEKPASFIADIVVQCRPKR